MSVLVTGGAGFIGSHLMEALAAAGVEAVAVDNLSTGRREYLPAGTKLYEMDITDPDLERVFAEVSPTHVFHLAAQTDVTTSVAGPADDARVNIMGGLAVMEQAHRHRVRKVLFSSSCAVLGEPVYLPADEMHPTMPLSPYGVSKLATEKYLYFYRQIKGLDFTALRFSNVYGPRQSDSLEGGVVSIFTSRVLAGERPTIFGDGEQTRDFIYVSDVAAALVAAMEYGGGQVINIATGQETSVNQIHRQVAEAAGSAVSPKHVEPRGGEMRRIYLTNRRAAGLIKWSPQVELAEGIKRTVEYHRQEG